MKRRDLLGLAASGIVAGCATPRAAQDAAVPAFPDVVNRIGFGSCTDQTRPQPIWRTAVADKPDLFIFGGDNVYASDSPWSLDKLQQAYSLEAAEPNFVNLRRSVPHLAIWDDHDFGVNDGGAEFRFKGESKAAFLNFWQVPPGDPRRTRDGIYHSQTFGPMGRRVQVILLDARWFRSRWKITDQRGAAGKERYVPDDDPAKTMLGEVQWHWLEDQLRQPADVRIIVSGIQVVVEGHGWERWGNFPSERQRLYRLIRDTRAQGVVFLSGDRHVGAIYRESAATPYTLYELTSSGITHPWREAAEAGPNRIGDLFTEVHFGAVDIDWSARTLQLSLKDINGATRRNQLIQLNELQVRT